VLKLTTLLSSFGQQVLLTALFKYSGYSIFKKVRSPYQLLLLGLTCILAFAPLLLERKAERILKTMDTEKGPPKHVRTVFHNDDRQFVVTFHNLFLSLRFSVFNSWKNIISKALIRPFALFAREPIIQLLGIYMAFIYGLLYCVSFLASWIVCIPNVIPVFLTTIPSIFAGIYRQSHGIAGLHYIALGVGLSGMSQLNARTLDSIYIFLKKRYGGVGRPEFRLR